MLSRSEFYCRLIFEGLAALFSLWSERYCHKAKTVDFRRNIAGTAYCQYGMADGASGLITQDGP